MCHNAAVTDQPEQTFESHVTIEATAEAEHPDRPLTAEERDHLGLPTAEGETG